MAEPVRNPAGVLGALGVATAKFPDMRVMQLIVNACGEDPFYVEDDDAATLIHDYVRENG